MQRAPQKIDYSRCPLWWWRVSLLVRSQRPGFGVGHLTFVRAADWEEAKRKAMRIGEQLPRWTGAAPYVTPMLNRSGLSRGTHEFAGYGDE